MTTWLITGASSGLGAEYTETSLAVALEVAEGEDDTIGRLFATNFFGPVMAVEPGWFRTEFRADIEQDDA